MEEEKKHAIIEQKATFMLIRNQDQSPRFHEFLNFERGIKEMERKDSIGFIACNSEQKPSGLLRFIALINQIAALGSTKPKWRQR